MTGITSLAGPQLFALVVLSCLLGSSLGVALSWVFAQRKIRAAYQQGRDQFFVQRHGVEKQLEDISKILNEERKAAHEKELLVNKLQQELEILRKQTVTQNFPIPSLQGHMPLPANASEDFKELQRKYDTLRKRFLELSRRPGIRDTQVGAEPIFQLNESLEVNQDMMTSERLLLVHAQLERIKLLIDKSLKICDAATDELGDSAQVLPTTPLTTPK